MDINNFLILIYSQGAPTGHARQSHPPPHPACRISCGKIKRRFVFLQIISAPLMPNSMPMVPNGTRCKLLQTDGEWLQIEWINEQDLSSGQMARLTKSNTVHRRQADYRRRLWRDIAAPTNSPPSNLWVLCELLHHLTARQLDFRSRIIAMTFAVNFTN